MPRCTTDLIDTLVLAQHLRDGGEHAGAVGDLHVQVEGALEVLDERQARAAARGGSASGSIALTTSPSTALAVWRPPAPGPDMVISVIASDSTVTALNGPETDAERVARVQEGGVHPHRQAAVAALGGADQLEPEPELARVLEVVALQVLDALVAHLVEPHGRAEREPREDRHLGGGVAAADVLAGVGLGKARALRLAQRLARRRARAPSR